MIFTLRYTDSEIDELGSQFPMLSLNIWNDEFDRRELCVPVPHVRAFYCGALNSGWSVDIATLLQEAKALRLDFAALTEPYLEKATLSVSGDWVTAGDDWACISIESPRVAPV